LVGIDAVVSTAAEVKRYQNTDLGHFQSSKQQGCVRRAMYYFALGFIVIVIVIVIVTDTLSLRGTVVEL